MWFWDGSGISWTICKQSAPRSRQTTTPTPHRSIFTGRMLFLTRNRKCQRRSIANEAGMCLENLTPNATPSSQKGREDKKKIRQVLSQLRSGCDKLSCEKYFIDKTRMRATAAPPRYPRKQREQHFGDADKDAMTPVLKKQYTCVEPVCSDRNALW